MPVFRIAVETRVCLSVEADHPDQAMALAKNKLETLDDGVSLPCLGAKANARLYYNSGELTVVTVEDIDDYKTS